MQKLKKVFYFILGLSIIPFLLSLPYAYIFKADNLKEFKAYWFISYFLIYLFFHFYIEKILKNVFPINMLFMAYFTLYSLF